MLYNGIKLPSEWPPEYAEPTSREPMPVPYLEHPPEVIPIDVGRQLFVDDFLIEDTNLQLIFHSAERYAGNPVLKPETIDELGHNAHPSQDEGGQQATCYLGHGGVFFDPQDELFKMYYTAGWRGGLAWVTSTDAIHWERPDTGQNRGNLLLPAGEEHAGGDNCVWLDHEADNPEERFKFLTQRGKYHTAHTSADGMSWSEGVTTGKAGDYCSFFYNPFRNVWVYSIKRFGSNGRCRHYVESTDFLHGATKWDESIYWTNADRHDKPDPQVGTETQLYSLNAVAYESVLIGMHYIYRGPDNATCADGKFPKLTDLSIGFSRDGFHWHRPDDKPFIAATRKEGDWDRAYLHSTTGVCLPIGDKLYFPYSGYSGVDPNGEQGMYSGGSIGLAFLRRDGFASVEAGDETGFLTTKPLRFQGKHLFVNVDGPLGELRVEVLSQEGKVIEPFSIANCLPVSVDSTLQEIRWSGVTDLSVLSGEPMRFRFQLTNAKLYAFWVSPDATGASHGYVGAGGPEYHGSVDTVGRGEG